MLPAAEIETAPSSSETPIETEYNNDTSFEVNEKLCYKKKPVYDIVKRLFDIVCSFIASIILLVPIIIISLIIIFKDGWSPFYKHKRVGKNGKPLYVYKFRSMRKNADKLEDMLTPEQFEEYKKEYKLKDDPRLIGYKNPGDSKKCFGGKIRRLSLDEIPQIFVNILFKGDMSIVGPRPILEDELKENYSLEEQDFLLSVKPGLTGYWQAYVRNNGTYETGERQKMELYYVEKRSFLFDLKIIFKTVETVLSKNGAE